MRESRANGAPTQPAGLEPVLSSWSELGELLASSALTEPAIRVWVLKGDEFSHPVCSLPTKRYLWGRGTLPIPLEGLLDSDLCRERSGASPANLRAELMANRRWNPPDHWRASAQE